MYVGIAAHVLALIFAHTPTTRQTRAGAAGRGFRRGSGRGFFFWNARLPGGVTLPLTAPQPTLYSTLGSS